MKKILVFGCPGSGKKDLAVNLGKITGYDVYHIEDDNISKKYSSDKKDSWVKAVERITEKDSWIIEGTQLITYDVRISRADAVIIINRKTAYCLKNYIKKSIKDPDMRFSCKMLRKIFIYKKKISPYIERLIEESKDHLMIYRIDTADELSKFTDDMRMKF